MKTGWWLSHPSEKYDRQIGSFPQVGVKIKKIGNHHPEDVFPFKKKVDFPTSDRHVSF